MSRQKFSKSYVTSHFLHELLAVNRFKASEDTINFSEKYVIGIGGAGSNIISQLNKGVHKFEDLTSIAINTDASHLRVTESDKKVLIGLDITKGVGTGNTPDIGETSMLVNFTTITQEIKGADQVFLITGLGGGTGTGATPILAKYLREKCIPAVTICTFPFPDEGSRRIKNANIGLKRLIENSQSLVILPNEIILSGYEYKSVKSAFSSIDYVVKHLIELMIRTFDEIAAKKGEYNAELIKNQLDDLKNDALQNYTWEHRKYPHSNVFYLQDKV